MFPPPFFGLDLKESTLRLAWIKKGRKKRPYLASCGSYPLLSPDLLKQGRIQKPNALASAIQELLASVEGEKIKTPYVAVSLPEEKSFIRMIQLPRMPRQKIAQAVFAEAEAYIPFTLEEVYLDWALTGFFVPVHPTKSPDKTIAEMPHWDILIAAVPKALADSYVETLKIAGLQPLILEPEPLCIARSLLPQGKAQRPVMILELSSQKALAIIYSGEVPYFSTTLPFAAQILTDTIKQTFKINSEKAESLKRKDGISSTKNGQKIRKSLQPTLENLVSHIKDYLDYYKRYPDHGHLPSRNLARIILCGSGAYLKGLPQFLSKSLGLKVQLGKPWINLAPKLEDLPALAYKQALGYTTAIGLALRNVMPSDEISQPFA